MRMNVRDEKFWQWGMGADQRNVVLASIIGLFVHVGF